MFLIPVISSLAFGLAAQSADDIPGYLARDKADFEALWSGTWSNDRQVFFAEDAGVDSATLAPKQEVLLTSSDEEGLVFAGDAGSMTSRLKLRDGGLIQTLTNADGGPACEIAWKRSGSQFAGSASGGGCAGLVSWGEKRADGSLSLTLSEDALWFSLKPRRGTPRSAQFRRVRPFTCWVAVLRGAEHGDSGKGMSDWDFRRGVRLHDQGGIASVTTDEDPARTVRLQLRDVDWTYGSRRPSLTLYVLGEDDRAVSYSWTEGGADRIGINLRWLQASCTADTL
ncbi:MAG: hypothetical protein AAF830_01390 [Pseudomonadota bacterium]